jgi:hypothetical protein
VEYEIRLRSKLSLLYVNNKNIILTLDLHNESMPT